MNIVQRTSAEKQLTGKIKAGRFSRRADVSSRSNKNWRCSALRVDRQRHPQFGRNSHAFALFVFIKRMRLTKNQRVLDSRDCPVKRERERQRSTISRLDKRRMKVDAFESIDDGNLNLNNRDERKAEEKISFVNSTVHFRKKGS